MQIDIKQIKSSLQELETERDDIQLKCIKAELELSIENIFNRLKQLEEENEELKEQHWEDYNIICNQRHMLENNLCTECKRNIERVLEE